MNLDALPELVRPGFEYALEVEAGTLAAPKYVRLAVTRFLEDVKKPPAGFRFVPELVETPVMFARQFKHLKGPLGGKTFKLEPWQVWICCNVFGFVDVDGHRRFRQAFCAVPRGNGKTTLCAVLALYLLSEGEAAPEVYSAAVTRDQARLSFDTARHMATRAPQAYRDTFGVKPQRHEILSELGAGVFKPLSSDHASLEGLNVHGAIVDEVASHKTAEVYEVLLTAMGKRSQPLMFLITTATSNSTGIGHTLWTYTRKLLDGAFEDPAWFGVIWAMDEGEEPYDQATWEAVNPAWGTAVQPAGFAAIARQARQNTSQHATFLQKHLNIFSASEDSLYDLRAWIQCTNPELELEDYAGQVAFLGLDLAARTDLAALSVVIPGDPVKVFCTLYIPSEAVFQARHASYPAWVESGHLKMCAGPVIDFGEIREDVDRLLDLLDVQSITHDPWQSQQMIQELERDRPELLTIEFRQTIGNYSEPTHELGSLIQSKGLEHDGNPVLTWCVSNVVGHYDRTGAVFPKKTREVNKIDGAVSLIMALASSLFQEDPGTSEIILV